MTSGRLVCHLGLMCALIAGCSRGPFSRPILVPVSGVVFCDGEPVAGAHVTFFQETTPRPAFGITDKSGCYMLTTFAHGDGAVPGEYIVTIYKPAFGRDLVGFAKTSDASAVAEPLTAEQDGDCPPPALGTSQVPATEGSPVSHDDVLDFLRRMRKSQLPQKYAERETTDLQRVIAPRGSNRIDFDLSRLVE